MAMRFPEAVTTDRLIRAAVLLNIVGMLMMTAVLLTISALAVGLFMLGSGLVTVAIVLYLAAVIRELRESRAL
jgi:hypothetical protein